MSDKRPPEAKIARLDDSNELKAGTEMAVVHIVLVTVESRR